MAKQLTADEASLLKKQARRRLIGAVALTTAMVVILPMVFDSEPVATVNDIELRIPDKDKAEPFHAASSVAESAPLAEAAVSAPVAVSAVVAESAPVVIAPVPAPVEPKQMQQGKIEPAKVAVAAPEKAEIKTEIKTAEKPQAAEKSKVEKSKTESKAAAHAVPQSGFAVQVAAFSKADSAKALQDKLNKQGLHAYTEKVGGKVRVRVGGFSTRDAADKVRHKLESQGMHPNVVSLGG
jgi:DedD protein